MHSTRLSKSSGSEAYVRVHSNATKKDGHAPEKGVLNQFGSYSVITSE
jgi:hypothetical protein